MKNLLGILILFLISCNFPNDAEDSWDKAVNDKLKIGVTSHPPYTIIENDSISGTEIRMLQDFAQKHQLEIEYIRGSESELIEKLENYSLHIIAGGFKKDTEWEKKAGLTATYDGTHVFLIPKGENKLLEVIETYIYQPPPTE